MRFRKISPIMLGFLVAVLSVGVVLSGPASSIAAKSSDQCEAYAKDYADHHSAGGGGAVGEAGKIVGGITGRNPAADDWNSVYNSAYDRCMNEG